MMTTMPPRSGKAPRNGKAALDEALKQSTFVAKLYDMMMNRDNTNVCGFTNSGSFMVTNVPIFTEHVLPQYFKHSKMRSFMRQLNQYGFERCWNAGGEHEYRHPGFAHSRPELLSTIVRRREPKGLRIASPGTREYTEEKHRAGGHQRSVSAGAAGSCAPPYAQGSHGRAYSFENNFEALFPERNAATAAAAAEPAALAQPAKGCWSTFDEDCEETKPRASTSSLAVGTPPLARQESGPAWAQHSGSSHDGDSDDDDSNHEDDSNDSTCAAKGASRGAMMISADELQGENEMPMPLDYMREALKTSEAMLAESVRQRAVAMEAWRAEKLELERLLASSRAECTQQAALLIRHAGGKTEGDFTTLSSAFEC